MVVLTANKLVQKLGPLESGWLPRGKHCALMVYDSDVGAEVTRDGGEVLKKKLGGDGVIEMRGYSSL